MTEFRCRNATLPEVSMMLDWAAKEGWNPGLDDAKPFYQADPDGFFVAETADTVVAAISVVNHSDDHAFLGLYLCLPEYRGRGIGFGLWTHALAHAGDRTVGLDGVPAQEANYRTSGFILAGRTCRWTGQFEPVDTGFVLAEPGDYADIAELDRAATGVRRDRFLRAWLENGPTRKTVFLRRGGAVTGFATARACRTGCKIGPIIAPDVHEAEHLARQAAASIAETHVTIDVPASAEHFADLLAQKGFEQNFNTARMYRGTAPNALGTLHAVASLELG